MPGPTTMTERARASIKAKPALLALDRRASRDGAARNNVLNSNVYKFGVCNV